MKRENLTISTLGIMLTSPECTEFFTSTEKREILQNKIMYHMLYAWQFHKLMIDTEEYENVQKAVGEFTKDLSMDKIKKSCLTNPAYAIFGTITHDPDLKMDSEFIAVLGHEVLLTIKAEELLPESVHLIIKDELSRLLSEWEQENNPVGWLAEKLK